MSQLDLIDWRLLGFSALWLSGLALLLAAVSFADYAAHARQTKTRAVLGEPGYQVALNAGLLLFCLGLVGSAQNWWEQALWLLLAAAFAYQGWQAWRVHARAA